MKNKINSLFEQSFYSVSFRIVEKFSGGFSYISFASLRLGTSYWKFEKIIIRINFSYHLQSFELIFLIHNRLFRITWKSKILTFIMIVILSYRGKGYSACYLVIWKHVKQTSARAAFPFFPHCFNDATYDEWICLSSRLYIIRILFTLGP